MKRYNVYVRSMAIAACLSTFALVGCEKESNGNLKLVAEKHQGGSKTTVSDASVYWSDGDMVNINGSVYEVSYASGNSATVEVTAIDHSTLLACYPADIMNAMDESHIDVTLPSLYMYDVKDGRQEMAFPLAAKGTMEKDGHLDFKHLCAALEVTVSNPSEYPLFMNSIIVSSATSQLCGQRSIDISDIDGAFAIAPTVATDASQRSVTLTFGEEMVVVPAGEMAKFQIPVLPIAADDHLSFTINAADRKIEGVMVTGVYRYVSNSITVNELVGRARVAPTPDIDIAEGASGVTYYSSKVSTSASNKIFFSMGDVEYNSTDGTWQFGQESDAYTSFNAGAIWDLFHWGNIASPYSPEGSADGSQTSLANDWGSLTFTDAVNDGAWYTPSVNDFDYMLRTRNTGITINGIENCHFLQCSVNGQKGLVIFPDNFASTMPADIDYSGWNSNNLDTRREGTSASNVRSYAIDYVGISRDDWAKLARTGCTFMVEDGWYSNENGKVEIDGGCYWTSTAKSTNNAYILYFNQQGVTLTSWRTYSGAPTDKKKINGLTVRLIRNA